MANVPSLADAIEGLYAAFARVPKPVDTQYCPCCGSPEEEAVLLGSPLRELTAKDLENFAFRAVTTWGDAAVFRHFLPRVFELLLTAPDHAFAIPEAVFAKPRLAGLSGWRDDEQGAVRVVLEAAWIEGLADARTDVDTLLCGIGETQDDLSWFLDQWVAAPGEPPVRHLAEWASWAVDVGKGRLRNPFWSNERPEPRRQLLTWITDPARAQEAEQRFFDATDHGEAGAASDAVDALRVVARRAD